MSLHTMFLDTIPIQITKKEFEKQLKHYKNVISQNHETYKDEIAECIEDGRDLYNIEGYIDDIETNVSKYEKYTITAYRIHSSEINIGLLKYEAKPGFYWK